MADAKIANGIQKASLSEQVRDWLLQQIGAGELQPGDRLVETRIAETLGISAIPVREAVRELTAMRVLESAPNRGSWVREVRLEETIEALQVRSALEPLAVSGAALKLEGPWPELRTVVESLISAAREGRLADYQKLNQRFHRSIVEASGNQVLLHTWDALAFEVGAHHIMDQLPHDEQMAVAQEHADILAALESGDAKRAAGLLARHARHLIDGLGRKMPDRRNEAAERFMRK